MKTKIVNKKGNKFLNKTSITKSQQQKNIIKSKKAVKKAKLAISVQNGNPTLENKVQVFKIVDKQKLKQNKGVKQQNASTVPLKKKIKIKDAKKKASSTTEPKNDISEINIKQKEYLERRQKRHNLRKTKRQHHRSNSSVASLKLNVEEIKKKIEEIRSREVLSKTAKKLLGVLNRKLRVEESTNKNKLDIMVQKNNKKGVDVQTYVHKIYQEGSLVKSKHGNNENKIKAKKRHIQNKINKIKPKKEKRDVIDVMKDSDDEDESDEDQGDAEKEFMDIVKEQIDDETDEDQKNEVDEEDTYNKASISGVRKSKKKQSASLNREKEEMKKRKKRHILLVDNLSPNVTVDKIKQHFLAKLGIVTNIKMHSDATHRCAYVMTANPTDLKKGLLLHDTFFMKKKISVQYLMPKDNKEAGAIKSTPVTKSKKLQGFQKAGKLVKNQGYQGKKKSGRRRRGNRKVDG